MLRQTPKFGSLPLLALLLLLTACGSTIQPKYYLLTPAADNNTGSDQKPLQISVGPVTLPAYLDRSQIVTRRNITELELADGYRWAEPLQKNFSAVLAENLRQQLHNATVVVYPSGERTNINIDYRVTVDVIRFDTDATGDAVLIADWSIQDGKRHPVLTSKRSRYRANVGTTSDYADIVTALSDTVAQLGRDITAAVTEASH